MMKHGNSVLRVFTDRLIKVLAVAIVFVMMFSIVFNARNLLADNTIEPLLSHVDANTFSVSLIDANGMTLLLPVSM